MFASWSTGISSQEAEESPKSGWEERRSGSSRGAPGTELAAEQGRGRMSSGELSSLILGESKKRPAVLREGYLTKQGGRIRSWKKRFFVLLDVGVVLYYKDKPAAGKDVAQGGFSIVKCSCEVKDGILLLQAPVSMAVKKGATVPKQSANRTFTMKGDDVAEWMSAIKKAKEPKPAAAPMRNSTPLSAVKKVASQSTNKHASSGAVLLTSKKTPEKTVTGATTAKKPLGPSERLPERVSRIGDELLDGSSSDEAPDYVKPGAKVAAKTAAKNPVKAVIKAPPKAVAKTAAKATRKPSVDDTLEVPEEDNVLDDFEDEMNQFEKQLKTPNGRREADWSGDDDNGGSGAANSNVANFHLASGDLEVPETQDFDGFDADEDERRRQEEEEVAEAERMRQEELERKRRQIKPPPKKALPLPTPPKKAAPVLVQAAHNDDDDDDDDAGMEFFRRK